MDTRPKKALVTVGTTKFDRLVDEVSDEYSLGLLRNLGYTFVQFQVGNGYLPQPESQRYIKVKFDRYIENFSEEIDKYDLVISHAGAGTTLQVLRKKKWLILVINDDLMDNHQKELAKELDARHHVFYCYPKYVQQVLESADLRKLETYPSPDKKLFSNYLDKCMGFE